MSKKTDSKVIKLLTLSLILYACSASNDKNGTKESNSSTNCTDTSILKSSWVLSLNYYLPSQVCKIEMINKTNDSIKIDVSDLRFWIHYKDSAKIELDLSHSEDEIFPYDTIEFLLKYYEKDISFKDLVSNSSGIWCNLNFIKNNKIYKNEDYKICKASYFEFLNEEEYNKKYRPDLDTNIRFFE